MKLLFGDILSSVLPVSIRILKLNFGLNRRLNLKVLMLRHTLLLGNLIVEAAEVLLNLFGALLISVSFLLKKMLQSNKFYVLSIGDI